MSAFKRFLLWDYPRAGWQYDVMVTVILAFIFLTPRDVFRDQPSPSKIVRLPSQQGANAFLIEANLLDSLPERERASRVQSLLRGQYGWKETVVHVQPIIGLEQEIKGYMAFTKP